MNHYAVNEIQFQVFVLFWTEKDARSEKKKETVNFTFSQLLGKQWSNGRMI